jgi:hypothetical protein
MWSVKELESLVNRLKDRMVPPVEVRRLLHHESPVIRVNALEACVQPAQHDEDVLEQVRLAASNPVNNARLMGTVSVAHVALGCLLRIGTTKAVEAAKTLFNNWPEPDKTHLSWYLESEGLGFE